MARIEYVKGIRCKQCGNLIANVTIFTPELCQECGALLIDKDIQDRRYTIEKDGESVVIKATHKLFRDMYEVVGK